MCHIYITLEDTDHSLPALVNPPEITHDISIGSLTVLKYPTLYMLRVHLEALHTEILSGQHHHGIYFMNKNIKRFDYTGN